MRIIISILFLAVSAAVSAQNITKKIIEYYKAVPQEKVFLHTDKSNYIAGDSIWFRGYLANAVTNRQSLLSYYMYVDLIDVETGHTISHSMIVSDSLYVYANCIPIPLATSSGTYRIVAYTNYMRNFSEDKFFSKQIRVKGFNTIPTEEHKEKKGKNTYDAPFSISLMPEGGNLIVGKTQKVAFKAIGKDGLGKDVEVTLIDEAGNEICTGKSQHLGMGFIPITPTANTPYYIIAKDATGKTLREKVPDALTSGLTLAVVQHQNDLIIETLHTPDINLNDYSLVIHGSLNIAVGESINKKEFRIPLNNFHEGVTLISLINKNTNKIIAERAIFIRSQQEKDTCFVTSEYNKKDTRSLVRAKLKAPKGLYSLSVTDRESAPFDTIQDNIVSSLMLSSEVKGRVEQPQYYFKNINTKTDFDLDLLMLTQAWRRYDITKMLDNVQPQCKYPIEQSQAITGTIRGLWKKNMKSPSLLIMCKEPRMLQIANLNESGRFEIDGIVFADSTKFLISALNHKGKTSYMDLQINQPDVPRFSKTHNLFPEYTGETNESWSAKMRYNHLNRQWLVELPDLEVMGHKRERPVNPYGITPDVSIGCDDERLSSCATMEDIFYMLNARMTVDALGRETFAGVVYVNDFPYEREYVNDLLPEDIERIEYLRRFNTATMMFNDSEGNTNAATENGVIIIKLKSPDAWPQEKKGKHAFATKVVELFGYKQDVEFYSPKYETKEEKMATNIDLRTTIYWNPKIEIGDDGETEIEFYTPDHPIDLQFDLQGMGSQGAVSFVK